MSYNKTMLIRYLNSVRSNVNAELVLLYLNQTEISFNLEDSAKIMPEILVEIQVKEVDEFKLLLCDEVRQADPQNFDFRFHYIKYKLGLFSEIETKNLLNQLDLGLTFQKMIDNYDLDIDLLYRILLLVTKFKVSQKKKQEISDFIGGASILFARKYQLREFSLSMIIALNLKEYFNSEFFENAVEFIEYTQTIEGYFGYENPFGITSVSENERILRSFYCVYALEKINSDFY